MGETMRHTEQPGLMEQSQRWEQWVLTLQAEIEAAVSHLFQDRFPQVLTCTGEYWEGKFTIGTIGYDKHRPLPTEPGEREG
jgi:hypothetical protein